MTVIRMNANEITVSVTRAHATIKEQMAIIRQSTLNALYTINVQRNNIALRSTNNSADWTKAFVSGMDKSLRGMLALSWDDEALEYKFDKKKAKKNNEAMGLSASISFEDFLLAVESWENHKVTEAEAKAEAKENASKEEKQTAFNARLKKLINELDVNGYSLSELEIMLTQIRNKRAVAAAQAEQASEQA